MTVKIREINGHNDLERLEIEYKKLQIEIKTLELEQLKADKIYHLEQEKTEKEKHRIEAFNTWCTKTRQRLLQALDLGNQKKVIEILNAYEENRGVNPKDLLIYGYSKGGNLAMEAVKSNCPEVMMYIIDAFPAVREDYDGLFKTLLHVAATYNRLEIVKILISIGFSAWYCVCGFKPGDEHKMGHILDREFTYCLPAAVYSADLGYTEITMFLLENQDHLLKYTVTHALRRAEIYEHKETIKALNKFIKKSDISINKEDMKFMR